MGKNKAKTAVLVGVAAKPEVEIWRRPHKWTLWPWFPIHSFRLFFARTYRFATIKNVTDDRQTDRQTTHCTIGSTDSTVGQKSHMKKVAIEKRPSGTLKVIAIAAIRPYTRIRVSLLVSGLLLQRLCLARDMTACDLEKFFTFDNKVSSHMHFIQFMCKHSGVKMLYFLSIGIRKV